MNPWEAVWAVFGWIVLVVLVILLVLIITGSVAGAVQWARRSLEATKKTPERFMQYMDAAHNEAKEVYKEEAQMPARIREAFTSGAEWGWDKK